MQLCWWGMCWSWDLLQAQQVFFHWNISHLQSQNIHTNLPVPALTGASTNWAPYKLPWQVTKLGCKLPSCSSVPLLILWNRLGLSALYAQMAGPCEALSVCICLTSGRGAIVVLMFMPKHRIEPGCWPSSWRYLFDTPAVGLWYISMFNFVPHIIH